MSIIYRFVDERDPIETEVVKNSCPGFPGPRSAKLDATTMGSLCKIKISWLVWVPVIVRVGGFPVPFYVNFSYQPWPAALPPGLRPARKRDLVKMGGYTQAKHGPEK